MILASEPHVDRVGNELAGFSIAHDRATKTLQVRGWGFWNAEVALAFGRCVRDACAAAPPGTSLVLDMNELKPMRDEGQASFGMLFGVLGTSRFSSTKIAIDNALTKLQLLRLATKYGPKDAVQFVAHAEGGLK